MQKKRFHLLLLFVLSAILSSGNQSVFGEEATLTDRSKCCGAAASNPASPGIFVPGPAEELSDRDREAAEAGEDGITVVELQDDSPGALAADLTLGFIRLSQYIINGTPTTGFPAVGVFSGSGGSCTATLVTSSWVLTAAHCVQGGNANPANTRFNVGGSNRSVCKIIQHPSYNNNNFSAGYDIAMVRLTTAVSNVSPSSLIQSSAPYVGQPLTLVGFGYGGNGTTGSDGIFGIKRVGYVTIDQVTAQHTRWTFDTNNESNTCNGDSGGPQFNTSDEIVSIVSGGDSPNCSIIDHSFNTRCDIFISWMQATIDANPTCGSTPPPPPTVCPFSAVVAQEESADFAKSTIQPVREFRDNVLLADHDGKQLTRLYYRHGPELSRLMKANPALAKEMLSLVVASLPSMQAANEGSNQLELAPELWTQGHELLGKFEAVASADLQTDIQFARQVLNKHSETIEGTVVMQFSSPKVLKSILIQHSNLTWWTKSASALLSVLLLLTLVGWRIHATRRVAVEV